MDLNSAWIFVRVIQAGSFSAAARLLKMPVSTVSTKVSQLEERLGVTLLVRTTRKLQLTEAGTRYFQHAVNACAEIQAAEAATADEQEEASGLVRLTAPTELGSISLADAVAEFLNSHPKIQVELFLTDRIVDLVAEGVDLAVRAGELEDSSLMAKRIGTSAFQVYASPAYLKRRGEPRRPPDLTEHDCLNFQDSVSGHWDLITTGKSTTVRIKGAIAANNLIALHRLVLHGRGIALLPRFLCGEDEAKGRLIQVLKGWSSDPLPVHLVYPRQKFVPKRVRLLVDYLSQNLREMF